MHLHIEMHIITQLKKNRIRVYVGPNVFCAFHTLLYRHHTVTHWRHVKKSKKKKIAVSAIGEDLGRFLLCLILFVLGTQISWLSVTFKTAHQGSLKAFTLRTHCSKPEISHKPRYTGTSPKMQTVRRNL